jgi:hypothetical protein
LVLESIVESLDQKQRPLQLLDEIGLDTVLRGGLLWWADRLRARTIVDLPRPMERLGPRGQPTPMLRELAARGGRFYPT